MKILKVTRDSKKSGYWLESQHVYKNESDDVITRFYYFHFWRDLFDYGCEVTASAPGEFKRRYPVCDFTETVITDERELVIPAAHLIYELQKFLREFGVNGNVRIFEDKLADL